jgi:GTP cyclohydrolase III
LGDSSANYVVGCGKTPGEAVDSALKAVQSINLQNPPR